MSTPSNTATIANTQKRPWALITCVITIAVLLCFAQYWVTLDDDGGWFHRLTCHTFSLRRTPLRLVQYINNHGVHKYGYQCVACGAIVAPDIDYRPYDWQQTQQLPAR